jgi:hypothetical protein
VWVCFKENHRFSTQITCFFLVLSLYLGMAFNLVQLLEQLKKFIQQENWSWFSLLLYIVLGLTIGDRVMGRLLSYGFPKNNINIIFWAIIMIAVIIWFITREVKIKKGKINIGIADLLIIHVNDTAVPLTYEQKSQIANEAAQYLYSQIQAEIYDGSTTNQINLIKLPSRIQVNFENERDFIQKSGLDVLIRGALKYVDKKYYFDYRITFSKKIESRAFSEIIQSINTSGDVEFDLRKKSPVIDLFISQVMRLSLLLYAIQDMYEKKFLSAQNLIQIILGRITQSVNDASNSGSTFLIQYLVRFVGMRNLLDMQERLDKNRIKDILQGEWIINSIQQSFKGIITSLKSYFLFMKRNAIYDKQFELEFLYAVGNNPQHNWDEDAILVNQETIKSPRTQDLLSGYFSMIEDNLIDAKLRYQSVLTQDHDNMIAMRTLGIIEYHLKNYALSKYYLKGYRENNKQHIFYKHYIDTKVLKLLAHCSLHTYSLGDYFKYYYKFLLGSIKNRKLRRKYIIL